MTIIAQYSGVLILVKCIGFLSMVASSFIIRHVLKRLLKKRRLNQSDSDGGIRSRVQRSVDIVSKVTLTQSIMLCLSCGDFISSFFVPFLSTWMVPKDINLIWASGNIYTCTAQGYLSVMFFGLSVFSNASLAVSHCLVVRCGWKDEEKKRLRRAFTVTPFVCALVLSIIPLIWQNYNYNGGFYCDISASPIGCDENGSKIECIRGPNSRNVLLFAQLIPFLIAFVVIIVSVTLLCHAVWMQERRMDRYAVSTIQHPSRVLTSQTTYQGIWYIAAFGITWVPWYCYAFDEVTGGGVFDLLDYLHVFTKPLQGLFNALVYFRPKYLSARARYPDESRLESLFRVLEISKPKFRLPRWQTTQQQNNETAASLCRMQNPEQKNNETEKEESKGTVKVCENNDDHITEINTCKNVDVGMSTQTSQLT